MALPFASCLVITTEISDKVVVVDHTHKVHLCCEQPLSYIHMGIVGVG